MANSYFVQNQTTNPAQVFNILSSGGNRIERLIVTSVPNSTTDALVSIYDGTSTSGTLVAQFPLGTGGGLLGAGVYELGIELSNGLTVTVGNNYAALTVVYS